MRGYTKLRVKVGACRIEIDEDDALAELREVDREVLGDEALADATAPPADGEHSPRALRQIDVRERVGAERRGRERRGREALAHGVAP